MFKDTRLTLVSYLHIISRRWWGASQKYQAVQERGLIRIVVKAYNGGDNDSHWIKMYHGALWGG